MFVYPFSFIEQSIPDGFTAANTYLSAVVAAGGTVTESMSGATRQLFQEIYLNGLNNGMLCMYPFIGGVAAAHAVQAISPGTNNLTFNGGWTHNASGATPNGSSGWATTSLVPSTTTSLTLSGGTLYFYSGTNNGAGNQVAIGSTGVSNSGWALYPSNASYIMAAFGWESNLGASSSVAISNTLGGLSMSRSGSTTIEFYRRGSLVSSVSRTANAKPAQSVYLGALNQNGTPAQYGIWRQQFAFIHTGLTNTQMATIETIINNYQTNLGRNVYDTVSGISEANAYLNAVVASGGTGITETVSAATRTLFVQLFANNLYSKIDIMYPCLGGVSASIAINAKRNTANDITFSGGWTFSSSGATGNGSNNVGYTNYKPGIVDNHVGFYLGTFSDSAFQVVAGIQDPSGNPSIGDYINYIGDNINRFYNNGNGNNASNYVAGQAHFIQTRRSSANTDAEGCINGTSTGSVGFNNWTTTPYAGTRGIGFGCNYRTDNVATQNSTKQIRFYHAGTKLTLAEMQTLTTIVNQFQTAIGRNIY